MVRSKSAQFFFSALLMLSSNHAGAEAVRSGSNELAALREELKALQAKVAQLESAKASAPAAASPSDAGSPILNVFDGVQISGTVDSIYSYNFNSASKRTNVGRVFDNSDNSINLNAAKITVAKGVSAASPLGFRTDILAGEDAKVIHSAGLGESSDSFDLEQAYAEVNVGTSKLYNGMNDINVKVGKFVTLAGAEVIESKDNLNTSRGFLFGYAIPFTHTGVRATYAWDNGWDLALGLNNGWDVTTDNNSEKTFEGHLGVNNIALPGDSSLTVALQGYMGAEAGGDNGSHRRLGDVVVTYKTPWKPLTLIYNFDYATQDHGGVGGGDADWYGHAGYAKIDLNDEWSVVGRGEYFKDSDGVRLVAGTPADYRSFTGTVEYRPWKNLITRLEYRNDHSNKSVFNDENDGTSKDQNTVSGEVIVTF